jgi:hypothetical protein
MMKHFAKTGIARVLISVLLAGLSMMPVSAVASAVQIGDEYDNDHRHLGGIVFYVEGTGNHGLVASKADLQRYMYWAEAKSACENLVSNSYSDWFLPNKEQLNRLYINRSAVGGFSAYFYWSSTEVNADLAWSQTFTNGRQNHQNDSNKNAYSRVRAVRAF